MTELTNPLSSFIWRDGTGRVVPEGCFFRFYFGSGERISFMDDGQLISRDPLTGVETSHGPLPFPCTEWFGNPDLDRRLAYSLDSPEGEFWIGSYDGVWDVKRDFGSPIAGVTDF